MCPRIMPRDCFWKIVDWIISNVRANIAMMLILFVWYVDQLFEPMPVHMHLKWPTIDEHALVGLQLVLVDH